MHTPINLHDYRRLALERLDPHVIDYLEGGALDELTVRDNERAFLDARLLPRVLRDISSIDTVTSLLGKPVAMPLGIAPTARQSLFDAEGELPVARAAAAAGVPFVASTMSSCSLEQIAAAGGLQWFQLYVQRDRKLTESLVRRAEAAGYAALVLTVDAPIGGRRERDLRMGDAAPTVPLPNIDPEGVDPRSIAFPAHEPSLTWRDVDWLRALTSMPLVIKGIMAPEDAVLAIEHGAAGVWVSNHGGRQLERSAASLHALPAVLAAVGGRAEVYVDGGVRRGLDAAIAVAMGARAVFLGRPILWALTVGGEQGVADALGILRAELENAMALLGAPSCNDLAPSMCVSG